MKTQTIDRIVRSATAFGVVLMTALTIHGLVTVSHHHIERTLNDYASHGVSSLQMVASNTSKRG